MPVTKRQSGSALLTVLLTVSALAAIILLATRTMISDSRSVALAENRALAELAAKNGIDEGLIRVAGAAGGWKTFQYGTVTGLGLLDPVIRGYTNPPDCTNLGTAGGAYDTSCPYYSLAVRTKVKIVNTSPSALIDRYFYSAKALPRNATVPIHIDDSPLGVTLELASDTNPASPSPNCKVVVTDSNGTREVRGRISTTVASSVRDITLEVMDDGGTCAGLDYPGLKVTAGGTVVIDQAATTIESVGYANGVKVGKIMTIYDADPTQRILSPMSGTMDARGIAR